MQGKIKKETFNDKCCALGIKHEDLRMFNDTHLEQFCSFFFETPVVGLKSFLCVFFVFINENKKGRSHLQFESLFTRLQVTMNCSCQGL